MTRNFAKPPKPGRCGHRHPTQEGVTCNLDADHTAGFPTHKAVTIDRDRTGNGKDDGGYSTVHQWGPDSHKGRS